MAFTKTGPEAFANLTDMMLEGFSPTDILSVADTGKLPSPYPPAPSGTPESDLFTTLVTSGMPIEMAMMAVGDQAKQQLDSTMVGILKNQDTVKKEIANMIYSQGRAQVVAAGGSNQDTQKLKTNIADSMGVSSGDINNRREVDGLQVEPPGTLQPINLSGAAPDILNSPPMSRNNYDDPYGPPELPYHGEGDFPYRGDVRAPMPPIDPDAPRSTRRGTRSDRIIQSQVDAAVQSEDEELLWEAMWRLRDAYKNAEGLPGSMFPDELEFDNEWFEGQIEKVLVALLGLEKGRPSEEQVKKVDDTLKRSFEEGYEDSPLRVRGDDPFTMEAAIGDLIASAKIVRGGWGVNPRSGGTPLNVGLPTQARPTDDQYPLPGGTTQNIEELERINAEAARLLGNPKSNTNLPGLTQGARARLREQGRLAQLEQMLDEDPTEYFNLPWEDQQEAIKNGWIDLDDTRRGSDLWDEWNERKQFLADADTAPPPPSAAFPSPAQPSTGILSSRLFKAPLSGDQVPQIQDNVNFSPIGSVSGPGGLMVKLWHGASDNKIYALMDGSYYNLGSPTNLGDGNYEIGGVSLRKGSFGTGLDGESLGDFWSIVTGARAPIGGVGTTGQLVPGSMEDIYQTSLSQTDPTKWWESRRLAEGSPWATRTYGLRPAWDRYYITQPTYNIEGQAPRPQSFREYMQDYRGQQDLAADLDAAVLGSKMVTVPFGQGTAFLDNALAAPEYAHLSPVEKSGLRNRVLNWRNELTVDEDAGVTEEEVKNRMVRIIRAGAGVGEGIGARALTNTVSSLYDMFAAQQRTTLGPAAAESNPGAFLAFWDRLTGSPPPARISPLPPT